MGTAALSLPDRRVFKLFGVYSNASAWALLTINNLFNALTSIPIFFIAPRTMTWALLPYAMYWSIRWVFDMTLGPLLLRKEHEENLHMPPSSGPLASLSLIVYI